MYLTAVVGPQLTLVNCLKRLTMAYIAIVVIYTYGLLDTEKCSMLRHYIGDVTLRSAKIMWWSNKLSSIRKDRARTKDFSRQNPASLLVNEVS